MNKGKFLVVDDKIEICKILENYLYGRGFDAKSAYSGAEAIELLKNEEFDLVLCDYIMPGVTGYDVVIFLNALEKRPKIGITTGGNELIRTREREEMKVDFFINKPFDLSELGKFINSVLNVA